MVKILIKTVTHQTAFETDDMCFYTRGNFVNKYGDLEEGQWSRTSKPILTEKDIRELFASLKRKQLKKFNGK